MAYDYSATLNPHKALIWRIVHQDNVPWVLDHGLHCGNSGHKASNWVHIGNPELIEKRASHPVPAGPQGCLNDYVPFYFTPFSPMLHNIRTGWGGITKRSNDEIVILVSSLHRMSELGLPFVFSDSHAYYQWANFYTNLADLDNIDWTILQARDFKRDPDDPGKFERYQAEALVHGNCPVEALLGMVCHTDRVRTQIEGCLQQRNLQVPVHTRAGWYFQ